MVSTLCVTIIRKKISFQRQMYYFLFLLSLFGPICSLSVPDTAIVDSAGDGDSPPKPELTFANHYLNSLDHKIETMTATLSTMDESIKQLQEKAHTWAIFRHHIDSWNDQMKALDHKIELIRRTQDENQMINQKLISQEFTLNHILSKVIYLSDSCNAGEIESSLSRIRDSGLGDIKKILANDQRTRNEISQRLSNILRHLQNIETGNCRSFKIQVGNGNKKMANLMHPISTCNVSRANDNFDLSLKVIEGKINKMIGMIPQKEMKQLANDEKRNFEKLEEALEYLEKIEERTNRLYDAGSENHAKLSTICQSMTSEISTFSTNSDFLLTKVEKLVQEVWLKIEALVKESCILRPIEKNDQQEQSPSESGNKNVKSDENETDTQSNLSTTTEFVDDNDKDSNEVDEPEEEIQFVEPTKYGCHELTIRVDGIYKFSTVELGETIRDKNERYCVFPTDGPAWTVIQNRGPYAIQENFNRSWNEYRNGFGSLYKDFWFGNEILHKLTYDDNYELRIELEDFEEVKAWVEYSTFRLDRETYNYNLMIGGYRGAIPDAMSNHNEQDFSTYDRRNDKSVDACCACATGYASGWWFNNCGEANLNGVFHYSPLGHNHVGIIWDQWHGDYSLKSSRMMIRPKVWPTEEEQEVLNESSEDP